ncbi:MAG: ABC transporter permease [Bacilli bacterium]|nr:ABC transporter permease [Bacilli bacterium]
MMKKFWFLTKYGLKKKFKSKSFIISNIIIFILLLLALNADSIISLFGGDFTENVNVYVIDETEKSFELIKENYKSLKTSIGEEDETNIVKSDKNLSELEKEIEGTTDIIITINSDEENYISANIITENYIDTMTYQALVQSLNTTKYQLALEDSNINIEELNKISTPPTIERTILDESKNTEEENMNTVMSVVFPTVILPFFMLIVLLVQMIGGEINEEKTTRSMEIIISNVSAKVHFFSKLVANNLFVIIQSVLLFVYGGIGFLIRSLTSSGANSNFTIEINDAISSLSKSGILDKLYYIIPITIVLIILSFVAYSLIAGILASMTVNAEDFQQIQTPIMIICFISYYLAVMASMFNGSILIRILSYVPLISFLLSPALLVIGQIGILDVGISIILLIIFCFILSKYGLKIYKVGILNYSTDKMWKRIFKAAKM